MSWDFAKDDISFTAPTWSPPQKLAKNEREAIQRFVAEAENGLMAPEETDLKKWLATLATLCSGNMSVQDMRIKAAAMVEMLRTFPRAVFTRETLNDIAKKSKWLPSYAEIYEVLEPKRQELLAMQTRAMLS